MDAPELANAAKTDAQTALDDSKKVISSLESDGSAVAAAAKTDIAKVKVFWQDYKFYLVAFVILVAGLVAGYHLHK